MPVIRTCKILLVAVVALFFTVVAYGNLADYGSNWAFVQHVLSMDTIFPDSTLRSRAITDPRLQAAAYWSIIAWEAATALVLWAGVVRLVAAIDGPGFGLAKTTAVAGLTMGFLLYAVGFVIVGGEWFAMWQSEVWNGQTKAFQFIGLVTAVLVVLLIPDPDYPV
jgi:predicted small integral membrane protein